LSSSRVRQSAHWFKSILSVAVRDRRLLANPAAEIDLLKLVTVRGHRYLTAEELHRLAEESGDWVDLVCHPSGNSPGVVVTEFPR
jgi:hypothetical protein